VKMRAKYRIDAIPGIAGGFQILQEAGLQIGPVGYRALFVVADTRVHHDAPRSGVHHQRVDAHDEVALFVHEVRVQPLDGFAGIPGGIRQYESGSARHLHLHHQDRLLVYF